MKRFRIILPLAALILFGSANPDPFPDDYFRSPLGIPLTLAGSFAEMRSNHFHSGLDIRTNSQPGYRVYSAAEGWISRIAVSPGGFGHALYVSHPNGYMTVYAHLDRFEEPVREFVKQLQYERESFDIEYFPSREEFPVSAGQVIAYSGNSGSSSGPHLHFEVRDERSGWPVNPLLFDFDVKDTVPPRIYRLKVYADDQSGPVRIHDSVTGGVRRLDPGESALLDATLWGNRYELDRVSFIEASGEVAFGLQTHDYHEGSNNRLGAFRITLTADDNRVFRSELERFSFADTRYINAHVDYAERATSGRWVQRSHVLPGNKLPVYEATRSGYVSAAPGDTLSLEYLVEDIRGNGSVLGFMLVGSDRSDSVSGDKASSPFILRHDAPFSMSRMNATLRIPDGAVYQDQPFEYRLESGRPTGALADVHHLHDPKVPVHRSYSLRIAVPGIAPRLHPYLSLARVSANGALTWAGGSYGDGAVSGSLRAFGAYTVASDSTAPTIRFLNMSDGSDMSRRSSIRVSIGDNFSGVSSYDARIDGEWALFEYDAKYRLLTYTFDERVGPGQHELELRVRDGVGNERTERLRFRR